MRHVTNATVREATICLPGSSLIQGIWLHFFWHVKCGFQAIPTSHYCVTSATLRVAMYQLAEVIDTDVHLANTGIHSSWRKADDCILWQCVTDMATPSKKMATVLMMVDLH